MALHYDLTNRERARRCNYERPRDGLAAILFPHVALAASGEALDYYLDARANGQPFLQSVRIARYIAKERPGWYYDRKTGEPAYEADHGGFTVTARLDPDWYGEASRLGKFTTQRTGKPHEIDRKRRHGWLGRNEYEYWHSDETPEEIAKGLRKGADRHTAWVQACEIYRRMYRDDCTPSAERILIVTVRLKGTDIVVGKESLGGIEFDDNDGTTFMLRACDDVLHEMLPDVMAEASRAVRAFVDVVVEQGVAALEGAP